MKQKLIPFHEIVKIQKQPSRGVLRKKCFENLQQIYRGTPMTRCEFNKVSSSFTEITLWHVCSHVAFAAYFQKTFS